MIEIDFTYNQGWSLWIVAIIHKNLDGKNASRGEYLWMNLKMNFKNNISKMNLC